MTGLYCRPTGLGARLLVEPELASWDRTGSPGRVRLSSFLSHAEGLAAPMLAAVNGRMSVELVIGLPGQVPLTDGGRDLDNYLFPLAQRLGAARIAAMFGRKIHGSSSLAIGPAVLSNAGAAAQFATKIRGSYERKEWKAELRQQLLEAGERAPAVGAWPVEMDIAITTGPSRNWANIWKPLIDAFGPVLGEHPNRPFHPNDDRITSLGLHHHINTAIGHDVIITAWWQSA